MNKSNWLGMALSALIVAVSLVWSSANAQKAPSQSSAVAQAMDADGPIPASADHNEPSPSANVRGVANVNVVNGAANPVLVRDVACHHKIPIDLVAQGSLQDVVAKTYNVPGGKVLVIEYINAYIDFYGVPSDMNYDLRQVSAWSVMIENKDLPGDTGAYWFPYVLIDRPQGWGENVVAVRMYCSTTVSIRIAHQVRLSLSYPHSNYATLFNDGFHRIHVSGYLEDAQ